MVRRLGMFLGLLLLTGLAGAQTKLQIKVKNMVVGTTTISQRVLNDNAKIVELKMELTSNKQTVTIRSLNNFDAKGAPTRKFQESIIPGGKFQQQIVATFDENGANLVILKDGNRETKHVPLEKGVPRANPSEFWFVRDQPTAGETVRYFAFNMDTLTWEVCTTTFLGKANVPIAGKSIPCLKLKTTRGDVESTVYVDSLGLPLRIESPAALMTRM